MDTPPPPPSAQQPAFPPPPPPPPRKSGKSGCLKIFLIVAAVLLVLGGGCVAAGIWWWSNNGEAFMAQGEAGTAEGQAAGRATDEAGCIERGRERAAGDASVTGMMSHGIYVRACLNAARETPGFCQGVPAESEFRAAAEWRAQQCPNGDAGCLVVMQTKQQYCNQERPNRTFGQESVEAAPAPAAAEDTAAGRF